MRNFNLVHDTQATFRKLLHAISHPGIIVSIKEESDKANLDSRCDPHTSLLALTLIDGESTFYTADPAMGQAITNMTYSKSRKLEEAQYIFCKSSDDLAGIFENTQKGSLMDPQQGATICIELPAVGITDKTKPHSSWRLSGPGIESEQNITLICNDELVELRNHAVREFPLGVDLFMYDSAGNCIAIPRTTKIDFDDDTIQKSSTPKEGSK